MSSILWAEPVLPTAFRNTIYRGGDWCYNPPLELEASLQVFGNTKHGWNQFSAQLVMWSSSKNRSSTKKNYNFQMKSDEEELYIKFVVNDV